MMLNNVMIICNNMCEINPNVVDPKAVNPRADDFSLLRYAQNNVEWFPTLNERVFPTSFLVAHLINLTVAGHQDFVGFGVSVHNHSHGVEAKRGVQHGRKLPPCFRQRVTHHKGFPTIGIASETHQPSSGSCREERLVLRERREGNVMPFVQDGVECRSVSVVIICEHEEPWALRGSLCVCLKKDRGVEQVMPAFAHTSELEEGCHR